MGFGDLKYKAEKVKLWVIENHQPFIRGVHDPVFELRSLALNSNLIHVYCKVTKWPDPLKTQYPK